MKTKTTLLPSKITYSAPHHLDSSHQFPGSQLYTLERWLQVRFPSFSWAGELVWKADGNGSRDVQMGTVPEGAVDSRSAPQELSLEPLLWVRGLCTVALSRIVLHNGWGRTCCSCSLLCFCSCRTELCTACQACAAQWNSGRHPLPTTPLSQSLIPIFRIP